MNNKRCRFCNAELEHTFLDLGLSPLSNEYLEEANLEKGQFFYPLEVKVCKECKLVQALEYQKPDEIFTNYKYFSSFSTSWLKHCRKYVDTIVERLQLNEDSLVCEIACNDGYLLQYFQKYNVPTYGVEPAENVAEEAKKKNIEVEVDFFGEETAKKFVEKRGKSDLIIGNNVLAHVPDINSFVEGIKLALKECGTVTMEFPHLLNLMRWNQFDTIYHEHFSYLSLMTVIEVFEKHGMKIYDVDCLETHGGSLRIYATHSKNEKCQIKDSVEGVLKEERAYGLDDIHTYQIFENQVKQIKIEAHNLLGKLKLENVKIVAFGAAAKGNTFLNYCGIGKEYIDFVADSSTEKQGLYLPGTRIPIVSPEEIEKVRPDYIIILPWNLKKEITEVLSYTREWGCKFITFIPMVEVF